MIFVSWYRFLRDLYISLQVDTKDLVYKEIIFSNSNIRNAHVYVLVFIAIKPGNYIASRPLLKNSSSVIWSQYMCFVILLTFMGFFGCHYYEIRNKLPGKHLNLVDFSQNYRIGLMFSRHIELGGYVKISAAPPGDQHIGVPSPPWITTNNSQTLSGE